MAITASELIVRKAATNNDTPAANGGLMGSTVVTSGATNNVLPNTSQAERTAGITRWRKIFLKNHSADNNVGTGDGLSLTSVKIYMDNITPAADTITFIPGTQTNLESEITGTENIYGCALVNTSANAGQTQIVATIEGDQPGTGILDIFRVGDKIRITDKITANAVSGNEEYLTIAAGGVGAPAGSEVTLTCETTLSNTYLSGNSPRVMSVYEPPADLDGALSSFVPTTASGTYTSSSAYANKRGAISAAWELRFNATDPGNSFELFKDTVSTGLTGTRLSTFSPPNASAGNQPYFVIPTGFWGGTWADGEVMAFNQVAAAEPIWIKQEVQAGTASYSANTAPIVLDGESA